MVTASIYIEPYLAEFLQGKYGNGTSAPISIPERTDLYHLLWDLMTCRRINVRDESDDNLVFILPDRRQGKDPAYYNYLSSQSALIISKKIRAEFNNDLHQALEENNAAGREFDNIEVVHQFLTRHGITSISEDGLLKNYYRWRENVRKRRYRRKYNKIVSSY